jgi:hypothetical protein
MPTFQPQTYLTPLYQQAPVYQQTPSYFAPPMFGHPSGSYQQVAGGPPVQPIGVLAAPAASAKNKRKKKKNAGASGSQNAPPLQV